MRLLSSLFAGLLLPGLASAQSCEGDCGPRPKNGILGRFGPQTYPLMESRYIKQFSGPHVSPDSCFGYFKPRVTPWAQACPNYNCNELAVTPSVATQPTAVVTPAPAVEVAPTPKSVERPVPVPNVPAPKPPTRGLPTPPRLESRLSPGLPAVAEPSYGPPPIPSIPVAPVAARY